MSDPDPCCAHEHQLDQAVRDRARAHGRPEAAERIAWGLPATGDRGAVATPDCVRIHAVE